MADDWQMDNEDASSQVFQAFRSLAPFLDGTLKLTPNPGATKRQKVHPMSKDKPGRQGGDRQPSESCHADDGKNDHQSGQGPADAEKGRHIHLLLQQGGGDRLSASAPKNSGTMAHTGFSGGIIVIDDTTETIAAADAVPGSHGSHTEASGCTGGVRPEEEGDGSLNLVARSDFPLLGVESGQEDPAGVQKDTTQSQQNASELHGDAGHAEQSVGHPTVPRTPDKGNQQCGLRGDSSFVSEQTDHGSSCKPWLIQACGH